MSEEPDVTISGTDAPVILEVSPWRTPYQLWCDKIGQGEPVEQTAQMYFGTLFEPVILGEYCRRTGYEVEATPPMLRHPGYLWMTGHLDARVISPLIYRRIVEIKTAGNSIGWGEPGTDQIPVHYSAQVHHYLTLADAAVADVAVLIGGSDFRIYTIERDEAVAASLIEAEYAFWQKVIKREPPEPSNAADAVRRWGRSRSVGMVTASSDQMAVVEQLRDVRRRQGELLDTEDELRRHIMTALGENGDTLVDLDGTPLVTWKLDKGAKAHMVKARDPIRRFLVKD